MKNREQSEVTRSASGVSPPTTRAADLVAKGQNLLGTQTKKATREGACVRERYVFGFDYEPPEPGETIDRYYERVKEAFGAQMEATVEGLLDGSDPVLENALEACLGKVWPVAVDQRQPAPSESGMRAITEAALLKRINRKLAHENKAMRKARTWTTDLGWYYVVDCHSGNVESAHHDDIVAFARDEGLVKAGRAQGAPYRRSAQGAHAVRGLAISGQPWVSTASVARPAVREGQAMLFNREWPQPRTERNQGVPLQGRTVFPVDVRICRATARPKCLSRGWKVLVVASLVEAFMAEGS